MNQSVYSSIRIISLHLTLLLFGVPVLEAGVSPTPGEGSGNRFYWRIEPSKDSEVDLNDPAWADIKEPLANRYGTVNVRGGTSMTIVPRFKMHGFYSGKGDRSGTRSGDVALLLPFWLNETYGHVGENALLINFASGFADQLTRAQSIKPDAMEQVGDWFMGLKINEEMRVKNTASYAFKDAFDKVYFGRTYLQKAGYWYYLSKRQGHASAKDKYEQLQGSFEIPSPSPEDIAKFNAAQVRAARSFGEAKAEAQREMEAIRNRYKPQQLNQKLVMFGNHYLLGDWQKSLTGDQLRVGDDDWARLYGWNRKVPANSRFHSPHSFITDPAIAISHIKKQSEGNRYLTYLRGALKSNEVILQHKSSYLDGLLDRFTWKTAKSSLAAYMMARYWHDSCQFEKLLQWLEAPSKDNYERCMRGDMYAYFCDVKKAANLYREAIKTGDGYAKHQLKYLIINKMIEPEPGDLEPEKPLDLNALLGEIWKEKMVARAYRLNKKAGTRLQLYLPDQLKANLKGTNPNLIPFDKVGALHRDISRSLTDDMPDGEQIIFALAAKTVDSVLSDFRSVEMFCTDKAIYANFKKYSAGDPDLASLQRLPHAQVANFQGFWWQHHPFNKDDIARKNGREPLPHGMGIGECFMPSGKKFIVNSIFKFCALIEFNKVSQQFVLYNEVRTRIKSGAVKGLSGYGSQKWGGSFDEAGKNLHIRLSTDSATHIKRTTSDVCRLTLARGRFCGSNNLFANTLKEDWPTKPFLGDTWSESRDMVNELIHHKEWKERSTTDRVTKTKLQPFDWLRTNYDIQLEPDLRVYSYSDGLQGPIKGIQRLYFIEDQLMMAQFEPSRWISDAALFASYEEKYGPARLVLSQSSTKKGTLSREGKLTWGDDHGDLIARVTLQKRINLATPATKDKDALLPFDFEGNGYYIKFNSHRLMVPGAVSSDLYHQQVFERFAPEVLKDINEKRESHFKSFALEQRKKRSALLDFQTWRRLNVAGDNLYTDRARAQLSANQKQYQWYLDNERKEWGKKQTANFSFDEDEEYKKHKSVPKIYPHVLFEFEIISRNNQSLLTPEISAEGQAQIKDLEREKDQKIKMIKDDFQMGEPEKKGRIWVIERDFIVNKAKVLNPDASKTYLVILQREWERERNRHRTAKTDAKLGLTIQEMHNRLGGSQYIKTLETMRDISAPVSPGKLLKELQNADLMKGVKLGLSGKVLGVIVSQGTAKGSPSATVQLIYKLDGVPDKLEGCLHFPAFKPLSHCFYFTSNRDGKIDLSQAVEGLDKMGLKASDVKLAPIYDDIKFDQQGRELDRKTGRKAVLFVSKDINKFYKKRISETKENFGGKPEKKPPSGSLID